MSLPSSFRKQSFFVRLSSGEIDLLDGQAIEQALSFGTITAETIVCEVGAHTWLPLRLYGAEEKAWATPAALGAHKQPSVVASLPDGPCRVRDRPLPSLTVRRTPLYATLVLGSLMVLALVARVGSALADDTHPRTSRPPEVPAVLTAQTFVPAALPPKTSKHASTLTADQRRRLHARDSRSAVGSARELHRLRPQDWARHRAGAMKVPGSVTPQR